jgi:hypothetical protein
LKALCSLDLRVVAALCGQHVLQVALDPVAQRIDCAGEPA